MATKKPKITYGMIKKVMKDQKGGLIRNVKDVSKRVGSTEAEILKVLREHFKRKSPSPTP